MKLGVVFPQTEIGADPAVIKDYAQTAEELGYDYLLAYDHIVGANPNRAEGWEGWRPYNYTHSFHEPFTLYSWLAAHTQRLEFVTGILILPQRQTALVAKQAAQLDILSGGRLRLGIGIGWNDVEYEALGENFRNRGKRSEEQVEVLRQLWTQELVTFRGKYHTLNDVGLNPLPVQRPIPIWFGGMADAVLRRMARLGDGWFPGGAPGDKLQASVDRLRGYIVEAGRDPQQFGIDGRMTIDPASKSAWTKTVEAWQALGATHLAVNTMNIGLPSPRAHIEAITAFMAEVK